MIGAPKQNNANINLNNKGVKASVRKNLLHFVLAVQEVNFYLKLPTS
jgi:hypothetical protein